MTETRIPGTLERLQGLGRAIKQARVRQNLQQQELAAKAGIAPAMLSSYETGAVVPKGVTLERILAGLGVGIEGLFAGYVPEDEGEGTAAPPEGQEGPLAGGAEAAGLMRLLIRLEGLLDESERERKRLDARNRYLSARLEKYEP